MIPGRKKKSTEELLKRESGFVRVLPPFESHLVAMIAILWAFFQLSLPCFLIIDSTKERAIHLAFAITLLFLVSPCFKKTIKFFSFLSVRDRIPLIDYALAAAGALTALYIVLDYEGIAMRAGAPTTRDLIVGSILVILLLEATRRVIGPALPVIALLFTGYAFAGPHMPDILAFKGVSLSRYLSNISLSTEGIYGIPLGVSSSIVYLYKSILNAAIKAMNRLVFCFSARLCICVESCSGNLCVWIEPSNVCFAGLGLLVGKLRTGSSPASFCFQ